VHISRPFIERPVMTGLAMLCLVVFGVFAYRLLPVSDLPTVDFPTISVSATLPGASAETMASAVATPLEKQLSTIAAIDSMTSTSSQGVTNITVQFALERDIDAAAQDVQSALTAAARQLPVEMATPPSFRKVNPGDTPIYLITLGSDTLPMSDVDEFAQTRLGQRLSMVPGVAQVQQYGSQKYAVRIQLDPAQLAVRGIGIDEVQSAVQAQNVNLPTGQLESRTRIYTIDSKGQLFNAAEYAGLVVAYRNGAPVRLGDLGRVLDSVQDDHVAATYNGHRAIILGIQRQPGANTVQVVDEIKALLPTFKASLPKGMTLETMFDRSQSIRDSVRDVKFTLLLAMLLVVLVIFLFLRRWSATLIPGIALPLSLLGTMPVLYLFHYSLDNLSLMALTLCVGFVVDDAIVMMENIARHVEAGQRPFAAALQGSREIGFTIVSMTLSLVAVFLPVMFMGGVVGRLLHEFAVTIVAAVLVSGVVSLTLTPLLCARLLKAEGDAPLAPGTEWFDRLFRRARGLYERGLDWALGHRGRVVAAFAASLVASALLFALIPKGFIPTDDTGQLFGLTEAAQDTSFAAMRDKQTELARIIMQNPHVDGVMSAMGLGGSSQVLNQGRILVRLKPIRQRPSADRILAELRPVVLKVPGMRVYLQAPPTIRLGAFISKSLYVYTVQDADVQLLHTWAPRLEAALRAVPGLQDVTSDLQLNSQRVALTIDRARAAALGVSASQIENALYSAYGQRQVGTFYTPTNQYWIIMEVAPEFRASPAALGGLYVRSASGSLVPLSEVTRDARGVAPLFVSHSGQVPSVTISFNLAPGVSLSQAISKIETVQRGLGLPPTMTGSFQGTAQAFRDSVAGMGLLLAFAVFVIYVVLGVLYESYIHPLTILSGLPAAGLGALVTLLVFGRELDLYAFVGVIMLVGIVKKNAIMMIDFALDAQRQHGRTPFEAIREACLVRFRPIMMTTFAALLGTLPIAISIGASGGSRQALGLAVVGGLLLSQFLTLFLTPVVYLWLNRFERRTPRAVVAAETPAGEAATEPG
jgi:hydrophobic/amphiphilic exporter-1 (mainly G- bacteria), HAE1 family